MNIANLSIKRPIFISSLVLLMVIMGIIGLSRLGVDLYPPVEFPVLSVVTIYPGASPEEIEKLISKPLEEQISTISGLRHMSSRNMESVSAIVVEFTFDTDVKYAEQKVREKVSLARNNLPDDLLEEPTVRLFDFNNVPVVTLAVMGDLPPTELYDLAKEKVKPLLEQIGGVGEVRLIGGTRREIQIELDRRKLNEYQIPSLLVANQLKSSGANIPIGKYDEGKNSILFRAIGEFKNINQIKETVVQFVGDVSNSITLDKLAVVKDGTEEPRTYAYLYYPVNEEKKEGILKNIIKKDNGQPLKKEMRPCIILDIMKQSGTNTIEVADKVMKQIPKINEIMKEYHDRAKLVFVYDTAKEISKNIDDVMETMLLGILLAVVVVYLFLGNIRSTLITGMAIPNSLLGAFALMYFMGFTINLLTLMALSLTVGLLVDDAIVVRENIFRKLEKGMDSFEAAEKGTKEVILPVIATTLTILAVFFPIAFLE
ncbi:MAG: efflux RND transporter permease subunit, partial [Ignavibacteria bacterium]|nr:efflux RND transporter permease subunit [Ignavibacteria bacterium]